MCFELRHRSVAFEVGVWDEDGGEVGGSTDFPAGWAVAYGLSVGLDRRISGKKGLEGLTFMPGSLLTVYFTAPHMQLPDAISNRSFSWYRCKYKMIGRGDGVRLFVDCRAAG